MTSPILDENVKRLTEIRSRLGTPVPTDFPAFDPASAEAAARGPVSFADQAVGLFQSIMSGVPGAGDLALQIIREQEASAREARLRAEERTIQLQLAKRGEELQERERLQTEALARTKLQADIVQGEESLSIQRGKAAADIAADADREARLSAEGAAQQEASDLSLVGRANEELRRRLENRQTGPAKGIDIMSLRLPEGASGILGLLAAGGKESRDAVQVMADAYKNDLLARMQAVAAVDPNFAGKTPEDMEALADKLAMDIANDINTVALQVPDRLRREWLESNLTAYGVDASANSAQEKLLNDEMPNPNELSAFTQQAVTRAVEMWESGNSWSPDEAGAIGVLLRKGPEISGAIEIGIERAIPQLVRQMNTAGIVITEDEVRASMGAALKDAMQTGEAQYNFFTDVLRLDKAAKVGGAVAAPVVGGAYVLGKAAASAGKAVAFDAPRATIKAGAETLKDVGAESARTSLIQSLMIGKWDQETFNRMNRIRRAAGEKEFSEEAFIEGQLRRLRKFPEHADVIPKLEKILEELRGSAD